MGQLNSAAHSMTCLTLTDVVSSASTRCKASLGWTCNVEQVSLQPLVHTACIYLICSYQQTDAPVPWTRGVLVWFQYGDDDGMPQSIGKIQSLQMIVIIRKSQSLAIAEYLYASAGMSSHPQARFIFSRVQALSIFFSVRSSSGVSNSADHSAKHFAVCY